MNDNVNELYVPNQHAEIELIDANETYLFAGRGTFKSSVGGGLFNIRRVFEMPRSTGVGVGISFNNLYENTVPPLKAFLLSKGFVEGIHFVICKPPPESWPKPYLGVVDRKYANTMTWFNGTAKQFISLRRKASANGVSAQWGDFDEVKFMDQKELIDEIFPIFRGNEKYFKHCSGYLSKFFMTDKMADPVHIKWLLKKRELVNQNKVDVVLSLAIELNNMKIQFNNATKTGKYHMRPQIHAVETRLAILRSNMVYVAEINIDDVRPVMGEKWAKDKERNTPEHEFNVIYKNNDPDRPGEAFYPAWDSNKLVNHFDNDIHSDLPFIIASDYQHSIAPIPVAQISKLPGNDFESLNYVDNIYTLAPKSLRDAVRLFCSKYIGHQCKQAYYVYDHTAIAERADAEPFNKIVVEELEKNGWTVWEVYTGRAPGHYQKYVDTIDWMKGTDPDALPISINNRCHKLKASISGAPAKTVVSNNKPATKKDKSSELEDTLDQSETTHFSDAFDMINDAVLKQKIIRYNQSFAPFSFK